jgi:hypothetical protein
MVCRPVERLDVVNIACPPESELEPRETVPSAKVTTSPSGMGPYLDETVAVNVTGCPITEGDPDVVTTVIEVPRAFSVRTLEIAAEAVFRSPG